MFTRLFKRSQKVQRSQVRMSSGFNKYPVLKVRPFGMSGNMLMTVGLATLAVTIFVVQQSGYLIPRVPGMGIRSPRSIGMPMDITPNELKAKE
ncbi:uncharacterized protein LOC143473195 [Clavelina lepadiformis]|uniref:Uncharacterized protein n=1 Tax=Clavelina lepadiformis TaxID=159417 RepID=A0ABP0FXQ8_CLALP